MNDLGPGHGVAEAVRRLNGTASVRAPLSFIVAQAEKPRFLSAASTDGAPEYLFDTRELEVDLHDVRPVADRLDVDREGFVLLTRPSAVVDFYDDAQIDATYRREIETLLRAELGANRVVIFDITRRADHAGGAANRDGGRGPAKLIHVDYTARSGPQRAADFLGSNEIERLAAAGGRIAQVNVWRPIRGPVQRSPLALADAASIDPTNLIATDQVFPDRVGEIYHLTHDPAQRWSYAPLMTADEVFLIKGWDSREDVARFTPHAAVSLPDTPADAPPRESIEVRTLVVFD